MKIFIIFWNSKIAERTIEKRMFIKYDPRKVAGFVSVVFSVFSVLFLLLVFFLNQRVEVIDISACDRNSAEKVIFKIEEFDDSYDFISITGYAYIPGESIDYSNIQVLAHDMKKQVYYKLPTEIVLKKEITQGMNDGYNYDYSGFKSVVYKNKIPTNCNIAILYRCNDNNILVEDNG